MNSTRDVLTGSDLAMPSGCEVETAAFHPMESTALVPVESLERSGMRAKLDAWKSTGSTKLHDMQRTLSHRTSDMKSSLQHAMTSVKSNVNTQMTRTQDSMRTNPMKWAGIAAGSGFAIGMIGRIVHWRNKHQRHMPDLVIIQSSC